MLVVIGLKSLQRTKQTFITFVTIRSVETFESIFIASNEANQQI